MIVQQFSNSASEKHQFFEMWLGVLKKECHVSISLRNSQESLIYSFALWSTKEECEVQYLTWKLFFFLSEYLLTSQEIRIPQNRVWECWSCELHLHLQCLAPTYRITKYLKRKLPLYSEKTARDVTWLVQSWILVPFLIPCPQEHGV